MYVGISFRDYTAPNRDLGYRKCVERERFQISSIFELVCVSEHKVSRYCVYCVFRGVLRGYGVWTKAGRHWH